MRLLAETLTWLALWTCSISISAARQDGMPPLCQAAWQGDLQQARAAVAAGLGLEQSYQKQTPLMWAAKMGHPEVASFLLESGAKVDHAIEDWTALRFAVGSGHAGIAAELLAAGADVRLGDQSVYGTLMHLAAKHDDEGLIELLAEHGAPLNVSAPFPGGAPLHVACREGNARTARALLGRGAELEARGTLGRTPLHVACLGGHLRLVEELIAAGAALAAQDEVGATPLHLAASEGQARVVEALLFGRQTAQTAELMGLQDLHGWTALHRASAGGHARCVSLLTLWKSDRDAKTDFGSTALHWACEAGDLGSIEFLLARGADPKALDAEGLTPGQRLARRSPADLMIRLGVDEQLESSASDPGHLDSTRADPPTFVAFTSPGYPGPEGPRGGLVLAVWSDGVVLFAADPMAPGKALRVGRIEEQRVGVTSARLSEVGFFDFPEAQHVGMHASSMRLSALQGKQRRTQEWDEVLPSASGSWSLDTSLLTFADMWTRSKAALARLRPAASTPLEQAASGGSFRGYLTEQPYDTPWLRR